MQVRNPQYNAANTVDCEIEHHQYGWIPFTASPDDVEELGRAIYAAAIAGDFGPVSPYVPPAKTPEQLQKEIVDATQKRLDDFAKTRGYDGILSACTYATSSVEKFRVEGQYCVDARDSTWATLYLVMEEVQQGERPVPTGYDDISPLLPVLEWPV